MTQSKTSAEPASVKSRFDRLRARWQRVPASIRKPVVLVAGVLVIIAAGATAPLPGPGGLPIFLLGIAILSTEFEWARVVRDKVVQLLERGARLWRAHKLLGSVLVVVIAVTGILVGYHLYHTYHSRINWL